MIASCEWAGGVALAWARSGVVDSVRQDGRRRWIVTVRDDALRHDIWVLPRLRSTFRTYSVAVSRCGRVRVRYLRSGERAGGAS